METSLGGLGHRMMQDWPVVGTALCLAAAVLGLARRFHGHAVEQRADRRIRRELEAYAGIPDSGDARALGRRVCTVMVEVSPFRRAAMLARGLDGQMVVTGSAGMDDATLDALNEWGSVRPEVPAEGEGDARYRVRAKSFLLQPQLKEEVCVVPLWGVGGRMMGVLAVGGAVNGSLEVAAEGIGPIEALAAKLARSMENALLAERLLRSEKLAGLGQLAGGVAHALNNPLTSVLGFAELIAETAEDPRVKEDAGRIAREAVRMQETVQSLLDLWRPATLADEAVNLAELVRELESACKDALQRRGVELLVEIEDEGLAVRGNRARLQQVFEHLLNNAAGAVGSVAAPEGGHAIRVVVRADERGVQALVSDTGPGFAAPARVFDPYDTTQDVGQGAGLGLSICYGIVREHGGEISAFNLHPRGAAVVMEFPAAVVDGESGVLVEGEVLELA